MSSASGTEMPPDPVLKQLCTFSSLFLPLRPPTPCSRRPCVRLSVLVAHVCPQPCVPVPFHRCIPDVLSVSHPLPFPFIFLSSLPAAGCVVLSASHTMTVASLSFHYRALPHPLLESYCWDPLLPLHACCVSFPTVAESKSSTISMCHTSILTPSELVHILYIVFHVPHFCFQPVHHKASDWPHILILLH